MKKRLFISSILMTLVLLVAITTATFAWYSATAAGANKVDHANTLSTQASTYAAGDYYLRVEYDENLTQLDLTDTAGNVWVSVGGYLQPATAAGATYGTMATAKFSFHIYSDEGCTTEITNADAKALALRNIGDQVLDVKVTASSHVRVTQTDGSKYSQSLAQTITIGTLTISNGSATLNISNPVLYSVSGNSTNTNPTANTAEAPSVPADQSITVKLAVQPVTP